MKLPEVPYADGIGKRGQLQFYGLDHNLGAGDGGLWDMQDLTSDYYPVLSTRAKRKIYKNLVIRAGFSRGMRSRGWTERASTTEARRRGR